MGELLVLHWTVGPFKVSTWYRQLPGDKLEWRGALCDCDQWEKHQQVHPSDRSCPHIDRVLRVVAEADEADEIDTSHWPEDFEMVDGEWVSQPPVEAAREGVRR